jgi:hypothetical protein
MAKAPPMAKLVEALPLIKIVSSLPDKFPYGESEPVPVAFLKKLAKFASVLSDQNVYRVHTGFWCASAASAAAPSLTRPLARFPHGTPPT